MTLSGFSNGHAKDSCGCADEEPFSSQSAPRTHSSRAQTPGAVAYWTEGALTPTQSPGIKPWDEICVTQAPSCKNFTCKLNLRVKEGKKEKATVIPTGSGPIPRTLVLSTAHKGPEGIPGPHPKKKRGKGSLGVIGKPNTP